MSAIDLNADLGEGAGTDEELLTIVSSASIACGGHAGDAETMRAVLRAAKANGVTCGAHPGFADPEHFGRSRLVLSNAELTLQIAAQLAALQQIADEENVSLEYVKLHGALANMAAEDAVLAEVAFSAVKAHNPDLAILALDNSAQVVAAEKLSLQVIREAYADRAYTAEGLLVSRGHAGAVLSGPQQVAAQCIRLAEAGEIVAIDGTIIRSNAQSICLHGDTPDAIALAHNIRDALINAGILIKAPY